MASQTRPGIPSAASDEDIRRRLKRTSGKFAVAMLELLARTARAHLVAANLAPPCTGLRLTSSLRAVSVTDERRRQSGRHFVFAGCRVDLVRLHVGKLRRFFCRRRLYDLNAPPLGGPRLAQTST